MKRLTLTFGPLALAAVLAACSGASAARGETSAPPAGNPGGATVAVVAKDITFVTPAVAVKAGAAFAIDFDNQDGAPHNIAISDAGGARVFKGDIVSSSKVTYQVPALAAGTYAFICEVHPDMKGTLTAQ
jgi:plastocyanin